MSLPYLVDFFSGCFTFYFSSLLINFENKKNDVNLLFNEVFKDFSFNKRMM